MEMGQRMTEMKKAVVWRCWALVVLFGIAVAVVFLEMASAAERVRIAMPGKLVDYSALYVGKRLGFYENEGLSPEFIVMSTRVHYAALQAGEVDYTTLVISTIRAAIAGMPVRVLLGLNKQQTAFLVAQPWIRNIKELKGKRVAVSSFGSSTDTAARQMLKYSGLDPNRDVIIMALGETGLRLAALHSRSIDAAVLSPPHNFIARREGFSNLLWVGDIGGEGQPTNGLSSTVKKLKEQPEQVQRMLRATVRSMIYVQDNKDKALPIVLQEFKGWDKEAVAQAYDFIVRGMSRDGNISVATLQEILNEERVRSGAKANVPVSQVADLEPLRKVLREMK